MFWNTVAGAVLRRGGMTASCIGVLLVSLGCADGGSTVGVEEATSQGSAGAFEVQGGGELTLQEVLNQSAEPKEPGIGAAQSEGGIQTSGSPDASQSGQSVTAVDTTNVDVNAQIVASAVAEETSSADGPLEIELVQTRGIGEHEASVYWQLNKAASGQVTYGPTPELGSWSVPEDTYEYEEHVQELTELTPGTVYYYRVHSMDASGASVASELMKFRTALALAAAEPDTGAAAQVSVGAAGADPELAGPGQLKADGWPQGANGDLAWGGVFYGNAITGQLATNSRLALQQSRRFRAQRSGGVVALRFQNRVLSDQNIATRCKQYGSSSLWCQCEDANLDRYTCGYALGNSYSVGNGGRIHVEVREDDGSGSPSSRVLARTDAWVPQELFTKMDGKSNVTMDLDAPADLVAGRLYHLVHLNSNPPTKCDVRNVDFNKASSCPRDQGMISLNGVYDRSYPTRTGRYGPFRGDSSMNLYRTSKDGKWQESSKGLSLYELHYADGSRFGESYHALDGDKEMKTIQGSTRARQLFTVRDATRNVDGVWVNFGHASGADGTALTAILRDEAGAELASARIEASAECRADTGGRCREWGHAAFGRDISLMEGQQYSVEFTAGSRGGFLLGSFQPLIAHGYRDLNYWSDAHAELSSDNGDRWQQWSAQLGSHRDMGVLFTLSGMPRKLP